MNTRLLWVVIVVLFAVIAVLTAVLIFTPVPARAPSLPATPAATSAPRATTPAPAHTADIPPPLSSFVVVSSPVSGSTVSHSMSVEGKVPGSWSFEAQFPLMVRDASGNVVGRATGHLEGEWQTTALVSFTAVMKIDPNFHGSATLVLLKDNPSGLPENDDSVEVPIIVD